MSLGHAKATNNLMVLNLMRYLSLLVSIFIGYVIVKTILNGGLEDSNLVLNIILGAIGIICLVSVSEWLLRADIKGATPLIIRNDGIQVKRFPLERLLGIGTVLKSESIKSVEVVRGEVEQGGVGLAQKGAGKWSNAPIELKITLKNGRVYRTGNKLPMEIIKMSELIRTLWSISVMDNNEAVGMFESYD